MDSFIVELENKIRLAEQALTGSVFFPTKKAMPEIEQPRSLDDPALTTLRNTSADFTLVPGEAYRTLMHADATLVPQQAGYQSILGSTSPPESEPERYQIGDRIGDRYEVLAIHKGSMGIVYGTFDHQERLPRALKTVQRRFAGNKRMRDLFTEEAALWVRLEKHPFIVRAYRVQNFENLPFVITEYVRGRSEMGSDLRSWLGSPSLTLPVAVEMALQMAQGMQHMARKVPGLLHGDLKPANVLVDDRGRAMVTDFGLAVAVEAGAGTPAYMAPEQWRHEPLDTRADIYAFGCILYEMLTGHRLFPATSIEQWRDFHVFDLPTAPRSLKPEIPEELEALVLRCISKEASARPSTWDEIVAQCAIFFHLLTGQPAVLDFSAYDLTLDELVGASFSLSELGKWADMLEVCDRALAIKPDCAEVFINKGKALSGLGREEEASATYDRALAINPDHATAWNNKGTVLNALGRKEEALTAFDRALAINQDYATAYYNKANILRTLGHNEEALATYDRALAINPDHASAWSNKGNALADLGRKEEALISYDRALSIDLSNALAWYNKGNSLRGLGRNEEALAAYDRALAMNSDHASSWLGRGNSLNSLGRNEEALAAYDRSLAMNSDNASSWLGRGNSLNALGRIEEALAAYDRALAMNSDNALTWYNKGNILQALSRNEEALAAYDKALAINPEHTSAWNNKGSSLYTLGRNEEALATYDRALAINPDHANAWLGRGNSLYTLGQNEEALATYERALAINPDNADAWNNKGNTLRALGRNEEALAAYDRALAINPDHANAWIGRGNSLYTLGQNEEALAAYDQALEINPDNADAWTGRGNSLYNLGHNEEALAAYDQTLAINPDNALAYSNREITIKALRLIKKNIAPSGEGKYLITNKNTYLNKLWVKFKSNF